MIILLWLYKYTTASSQGSSGGQSKAFQNSHTQVWQPKIVSNKLYSYTVTCQGTRKLLPFFIFATSSDSWSLVVWIKRNFDVHRHPIIAVRGIYSKKKCRENFINAPIAFDDVSCIVGSEPAIDCSCRLCNPSNPDHNGAASACNFSESAKWAQARVDMGACGHVIAWPGSRQRQTRLILPKVV